MGNIKHHHSKKKKKNSHTPDNRRIKYNLFLNEKFWSDKNFQKLEMKKKIEIKKLSSCFNFYAG